jgi:hypothetical protein
MMTTRLTTTIRNYRSIDIVFGPFCSIYLPLFESTCVAHGVSESSTVLTAFSFPLLLRRTGISIAQDSGLLQQRNSVYICIAGNRAGMATRIFKCAIGCQENSREAYDSLCHRICLTVSTPTFLVVAMRQITAQQSRYTITTAASQDRSVFINIQYLSIRIQYFSTPQKKILLNSIIDI